MPRRRDETERVGLCSIVRASNASKSSNVVGPFTKSVMCFAFCALTPGVMSIRVSELTRSGRSLATNDRNQAPKGHPHQCVGPRGQLVECVRDVASVTARRGRAIGRGVGVSVTGQVERDHGALQRQCDGVKSVGVLCATVYEDQQGFAVAPGESAQLSKSVNDHEEASHRWHGDVEVPLVEVLVKK